MLSKSPGFTAVAVLTIALGLGATTAIFSAVNTILFEPLPYPHAGRIIMIWDIFQGSRSDVTFHTYHELLERSRSFEALAAMEPWQPTMTGPAEPERLNGQSVSGSYFRVLGVPPALGRDFQASDDIHNGRKVVILSDRLWRRRFSADRKIVGRQIKLDDDLYTVVAVMPGAFENVLSPSSELWAPLQYDTQHGAIFDTREWGHHLRMAGRLRPGVSIERARRDLDAIAHTRVPEFPRAPWASLEQGFIINTLQDEVTRGVKPALLAVLGAVVLLLTIACVNVTNLLLARGAQRRGEFAVRAALGARRLRLARQLLTESLLLAALGGAVGLEVAQFGVNAFVAFGPRELPRVGAIVLNATVFAFALGITTLIGLAVGLIPALYACRTDLRTGILQSSRGSTAGHQWTRRTLVLAQVSLALVLLVCAGLMLHSLERLLAVKPGFDGRHLLTMQVQTSGHQFDDLQSAPGVGSDLRRRFFAQALEAVRRVPGVKAAAFTSLLPLSGDQYGMYGAKFEAGGQYNVYRYVVTPGYFETMGIALRRGRLLDEHDVAGAVQAVVISESLARREFPGRDPVGQRVHVGPVNRPWYNVVGEVGDVKQTSLAVSDPDAVYITSAQSWFADDAMSLVVRARGDATALTPTIRKAVWSVDKNQPIVRVATMDSLFAAMASQRRFILMVFEGFALVALLLAATGIYGVLSGSVNERTHEIGIRSALGASRADILAQVLRQGAILTGLGTVIGLAGAVVASQAIVSLLFGVSRLDPITYLAVTALLAGVALVATYIPARRATKVDPMVALRYE
jgi:putative ABC transport system permease protein